MRTSQISIHFLPEHVFVLNVILLIVDLVLLASDFLHQLTLTVKT